MPNNSGNSSGMMMMVMMLMVGCAFMMSSALAGYFVMTNPDLLGLTTAPALPTDVIDTSATTTTETTSAPSKSTKKKTTKSGDIPSQASAYIQAEECASAGKDNHVLAAGARHNCQDGNSVSLWCKEPVKFYFDGPKSAGSDKFYYLRLSNDKSRALKGWPGIHSPYMEPYKKGDTGQQWVIRKNDDGKTYSMKNRGLAKISSTTYAHLGASNDCDRIDKHKRQFLHYWHSPGKFTFHKGHGTMALKTGDCPKYDQGCGE